MIISFSQPYFAPYVGFFHKAHLADVLVLLDDVQFPRKTTWITRNRFKNEQGTLWMTVPVRRKGLGLQKISEVRICGEGGWQKKHLRTFHNAYSNAPYLSDHLELLENMYLKFHDRILDLNIVIIDYLADYLGLETQIIRMSHLGLTGQGTDLILAICQALGATQFLVQVSALKYYDAERFTAAGIHFTGYRKPDWVYPQLWGDFIANLSILDLIFNCGPKSREIVFGR
jgi:hypothetical protein